jgi:hypothetical protein
MKFLPICLLFFTIGCATHAQTISPAHSSDSLKQEILKLRADVDMIQLNLATGEKKFKRGIVVATIGYSVTIAGGLMLGRKYDDAGKVLLVAGGVTGITGTIMMMDAFKYLGRAGGNTRKK